MEHKNHINRNTVQHSVITDYKVNLFHEFDWRNVKILDEKCVLNKKLPVAKSVNGIFIQINGKII